MAHKVIAADLGASRIRLARFDASFRKLALLDTRLVALGDTVETRPEERIPAQLALIAQVMAADKYEAEEVAVALPGDVLTFRVVDLPFANPRQIEQTIGYELESLILTPVEELVIDFLVLGPARGPAGTTPETRVLAACAPRALIEKIVKTAQELQLPLRMVAAAPFAYASVFESPRDVASQQPGAALQQEGATSQPGGAAPPLATDGGEPAEPAPERAIGAALVVDVGLASTTVCALRAGKPELSRTISRGGRHVTDAIANVFKLDPDRAEAAKIEAGFVAHRGTPRLSASQAAMDAAVREAIAPLVRELRQTIAAYRATYGDEVERIVLAGGGARLAGFAEHLAEELGVPAERGVIPPREAIDDAAIAGEKDDFAVALGLGLATTAPGTQVNFRKGEFAYRSDYSFLRDKAIYFAVAASLVVGFAGFDAWASMRGLSREHEVLSARLKTATKEIFGKERDDAQAISDEVKGGPKGVGQLPIPTMTAFDILDEISRVVPPSDKIRLDILELDIRPKKTQITATTETAQQVDDFADALRKIDCFEDVQKGKLATITVTAPPPPATDDKDKDAKNKDAKDNQPTELKQFAVQIRTSCP